MRLNVLGSYDKFSVLILIFQDIFRQFRILCVIGAVMSSFQSIDSTFTIYNFEKKKLTFQDLFRLLNIFVLVIVREPMLQYDMALTFRSIHSTSTFFKFQVLSTFKYLFITTELFLRLVGLDNAKFKSIYYIFFLL